MKKFLFAVLAIFLGIVTGKAQGNKELTGEIREALGANQNQSEPIRTNQNQSEPIRINRN